METLELLSVCFYTSQEDDHGTVYNHYQEIELPNGGFLLADLGVSGETSIGEGVCSKWSNFEENPFYEFKESSALDNSCVIDEENKVTAIKSKNVLSFCIAETKKNFVNLGTKAVWKQMA